MSNQTDPDAYRRLFEDNADGVAVFSGGAAHITLSEYAIVDIPPA